MGDDGVTDVIASGSEDNDVMWYENSRFTGETNLNPTFAGYSMGLIPDPYDLAIDEDGFGFAMSGLVIIVTNTGA